MSYRRRRCAPFRCYLPTARKCRSVRRGVNDRPLRADRICREPDAGSRKSAGRPRASTLPPEAEKARDDFVREYGGTSPEQADVIVALGGDGLMLQTLHKFMSSGKPIYGMHRGTVGFLMNDFAVDKLQERLRAAQNTAIHPLLMCATDAEGQRHESYAINEV